MRVQHTWLPYEMLPTLLKHLPRKMKLSDRSQQWCKTPSHPAWKTCLRAIESTSTYPSVPYRHRDAGCGKRSCYDIIEMVGSYSSARCSLADKTVAAKWVNLGTTTALLGGGTRRLRDSYSDSLIIKLQVTRWLEGPVASHHWGVTWQR